MKYVRPDDAVSTYRYLRIALVALVVFLGASIVDTRLAATCWQGSISAYYYTTSHAVFVATLCAVGVSLIVYQGSSRTEDMLLNFSGTLAFAVALVPTRAPTLCGPALPTLEDATIGVGNNIRALLIAVAAGAAVYAVIRAVAPDPPTNTVARTPRPITLAESALQAALLTLLIVYFGLFLSRWRWFLDNRHHIAAVAMFVGIILVVLHYALYAARGREANRRRYVGLYLGVAAAMVVTLVLAGLLAFWNRPLGVLIVEALLIASFGVFWLVQSFDLWQRERYPVGSLDDPG
ncbi:diphosphate--fructose-6-phosphate 1-phosphotransferase [Mycobacterium sp. MYCO198283]|uniref:diphosphate--fructose-6-phosphate 1-phosphotransferase n=1 Tax=Mycobacterium sp. MYCO198283 TaxID=2883505 RepID=UPI001E2D3CC5|nr:diphosphate--fructose-6-phosphate 1-phosphotransferase [Mycobacterium sp. MYCO198283]MCG5430925.1 diphosphate--fructose-6-phosphate 1-phosphotransferase [Mycobacterium sp. MYCO198283]